MAKKQVKKDSISKVKSKSIKKKSKKLHRYEKQKYPALNPKYQVANRRELLGDIDYIDKLNDKEKEFLNSFLSETVITNFKHRGKKLIKTKEKKRELYRENNRRNIDLYNVTKQTGKLMYTGAQSKTNPESNVYVPNSAETTGDVEDALIAALDLEKAYNMINNIDSMTAEQRAVIKELIEKTDK